MHACLCETQTLLTWFTQCHMPIVYASANGEGRRRQFLHLGGQWMNRELNTYLKITLKIYLKTSLSVAFLVFISFAAQKVSASDWSQVKLHPATEQTDAFDSEASISRPLLGLVYQEIFQKVDKTSLLKTLKQISGGEAVSINGKQVTISDRYLPASKANFRAFWLQYFQNLGITGQEMSYPTRHHVGETMGHNLEAVLPGRSPDSIVIIVHYDSIGPSGDEAGNPGVDDDMTGMAIMMETARILSQYKGQLDHTVRFIAADYEEHASPGLEGARQYAKYLKALSQKEKFKIVSAVDNEQSGWNCAADGSCKSTGPEGSFDVFSCSGDGFDYTQLGDSLSAVATQYSKMKVNRGCMGANSDHYAMWEIGVPTVVYSEHNPFDNDHFDKSGGDTFDKIDQNYYFKIAQIGVTFAATMAGINVSPEPLEIETEMFQLP